MRLSIANLGVFLTVGFASMVVSADMATPTNSSAGDGLPWYVSAGASLNLNVIGENDEQAKFKPITLAARVGKYIEPQVSIEVFGAKGVSGDDDLGIDMKMISNVGILGRFESPEKEGLKLHLQVGYGATELEMRRTSSSLPDRELYHGGVFGGGVEFRLGDSSCFLNIQGLRQYSQNNLSIDTGSVELRYEF